MAQFQAATESIDLAAAHVVPDKMLVADGGVRFSGLHEPRVGAPLAGTSPQVTDPLWTLARN